MSDHPNDYRPNIQPTSITYPSGILTIAAHLYHPPTASSNTRLPAVIVSHPGSGVKEQTAGLYAAHLAQLGYISLAFDCGYQGESTGEPRGVENPYQRVEDIKSGVTYLSNRSDVDPQHIGALGICASGGYVPFAAITDRRINAVATISAFDFGEVTREGLGGGQPVETLMATLKAANDDRLGQARGEKPVMQVFVPNDPRQVTDDMPTLYKEGCDYYRTPRAQHPRSINLLPMYSFDIIASFAAYDRIQLLSPTPLLMIAGTKADTLYFSEKAIKQAKEPKQLHLIDGASHVDLYDKPQYVTQAVQQLKQFFNKTLNSK